MPSCSTLRSMDLDWAGVLAKKLAVVSEGYRLFLAYFFFLACSHFLLFEQSTFQVRSIGRL